MSFKNIFSIILLFSALLIISCEEKKDKKQVEKLIVRQQDKNPGVFELKKYINLELPKNVVFSGISRLKIRNNKVYILNNDYEKHYVFVYNLEGKFLNTIGGIGLGKTQYQKICDFDVNGKGDVHLYDKLSKKILIYTDDDSYVKSLNISFEADSFSLLSNGGYIFSTPKNHKVKNSDKVAVTDASLNIIKTYFSYNESFKDNKRNAFLFRESSKGLLFNRPIDDHLVLFDKKNGNVLEEYQMDFGFRALPQNLRDDYTLYTGEEIKKYDCMFETPFLISNTLFGDMYFKDKKALFTYDFDDKTNSIRVFYKSRLRAETLFFPLFVYNDSMVVSYVNSYLYKRIKDKKNIDFESGAHLNKGGYLITFFEKKS